MCSQFVFCIEPSYNFTTKSMIILVEFKEPTDILQSSENGSIASLDTLLFHHSKVMGLSET